MKKNLLHLPLFNAFLLIFATSCSVTEKISQWQDKTIVPDGIPAEYTIPLNHYDSDTKIQYTLSNDLENLYFCIRATEEEAQIKILQAGVQILIDTTGRGKEFVSIQFPLPHDKSQGPPPNGKPDMKPEPNDSNKPKNPAPGMNPMFGLDEMQLDGFKEGINGRISMENPFGIRFAIKVDAYKNMTFEGIVPFKTFFKDKLSVADASGQFVVLININAMEAPKMAMKDMPAAGDENRLPGGGEGGNRPDGNMRQGGGGMPPGNGMPHGGGGMPEGRGGAVDNTKTYPFETVNTIKIKYKLALPGK